MNFTYFHEIGIISGMNILATNQIDMVEHYRESLKNARTNSK